MQPNRNPITRPEDIYFSRCGEELSGLIPYIKTGALIVVSRLPGSKGSAIGLMIKELKGARSDFRPGASSGSLGLQWPENPGELNITEAQDNLNWIKQVKRKPESTSNPSDKPLLNIYVISASLDADGKMASNLDYMCKFLTPMVRENDFVAHKNPQDGGVISTVLLDIEVPSLNFDVKQMITGHLQHENTPSTTPIISLGIKQMIAEHSQHGDTSNQASIVDFDTRAFDRSNLLNVFEDIMLPAEFKILHRTPSFKKLNNEYGGNADFSIEIYLRMRENLQRDGYTTTPFADAFKAIEPRYVSQAIISPGDGLADR